MVARRAITPSFATKHKLYSPEEVKLLRKRAARRRLTTTPETTVTKTVAPTPPPDVPQVPKDKVQYEIYGRVYTYPKGTKVDVVDTPVGQRIIVRIPGKKDKIITSKEQQEAMKKLANKIRPYREMSENEKKSARKNPMLYSSYSRRNTVHRQVYSALLLGADPSDIVGVLNKYKGPDERYMMSRLSDMTLFKHEYGREYPAFVRGGKEGAENWEERHPGYKHKFRLYASKRAGKSYRPKGRPASEISYDKAGTTGVGIKMASGKTAYFVKDKDVKNYFKSRGIKGNTSKMNKKELETAIGEVNPSDYRYVSQKDVSPADTGSVTPFSEEERAEIEQMSKHGFGTKAEAELKEKYGIPKDAKLTTYDPKTGEVSYVMPTEYREAKAEALAKLETSEGYAEYLSKVKAEGGVPDWKKTPIDWLAYQAEGARTYYGLKAKETDPGTLTGFLSGAGLMTASFFFGIGKGIVDVGEAAVHPVRTAKAIKYAVTHPVTTAKTIYTYTKKNPFETAGGVVGDIMTGKIVSGAVRPFSSKIKYGVRSKIGKVTGAFVPEPETGIKFVKAHTIPTDLTELKKVVGKKGTHIHVTQSPLLRGAYAAKELPGGAVIQRGQQLLEAVPGQAGGLRKSAELYSFYKSVAPEFEAPRAYLGYAGVMDAPLDMAKVPSKLKLVPTAPSTRAIIFEDEMVSAIPKAVEETGDVAAINKYIQEMGSGQTFLAPENIAGLSTEAQVVTPTAYKGAAYATKEWAGSIIEFAPMTTARQKVGRVFGKELGEQFTYVKQPMTPPTWVSKRPTLTKLWEKTTGKYTKIELVKAKTLPVTGALKKTLTQPDALSTKAVKQVKKVSLDLGDYSKYYGKTKYVPVTSFVAPVALTTGIGVSTTLPYAQTSYAPSYTPSYTPAYTPTYTPSYTPAYKPTYKPTYKPKYAPTYKPKYAPKYTPTYAPKYTPKYTPTYTPPYSPKYTPTYTPTYTPKYTPTYDVPYTPPEEPFIPIPDEKGKKAKAYHTYARESRPKGVKEKIEWVKVSKTPLPRKKALNLGMRYVDNTTAATTKIVRSGHTYKKDDRSLRLINKFRPPKGKSKLRANVFIEKNKHRVDTWNELEGITVKGLLAQEKGKGVKAARKIYSGLPMGFFGDQAKKKGIKNVKVPKL